MEGLPGKFLQPPAELPLTQRPWLTDTVQLCLSSPCSVSGVRLHISNFVKFLLKSSKDILEGNMKEEACRRRTFLEDVKAFLCSLRFFPSKSFFQGGGGIKGLRRKGVICCKRLLSPLMQNCDWPK